MAGQEVRSVWHSSVPTWLGLVLGSWVGLAWGSLISAPVGIGFGVAAGSVMGGFLAVPLWGTFWGLVGLGRQRDNAVAARDTTQLKEDDPLAQRVYALASQLGMTTKPWVAVMPHNNAYAIGSGPTSALVVIGQPLIDSLTERELDAIIGHELGHIVNNDMRRMGLARSFQNALTWYLGFSHTLQRFGRWLLTWMSEIYILRLSRKREYWADAFGAALTSKDDMIRALEKLHAGPELSGFEKRYSRLMVRGFAGGSLLSTHPTLDERKAALQSERYLRKVTRPVAAAGELAVPAGLPTAEEIAYARS
ncbi:Protease protein, heat-shock-like [Agrobacterium fabacearum CFBP 5771]|uniref:M48 family metalloprotease n=1 Tax=Agrobacterium tumefaciens TaxID=358 RepID=UPI0009C58015|nr:M48 family metalloprotease [Agrobacterium tumefaciens]CVI17416.1 Protease protein, heat-shock-like [Agrobacterium fabacearum CFBP 5771]